jgi:hypothetical protein
MKFQKYLSNELTIGILKIQLTIITQLRISHKTPVKKKKSGSKGVPEEVNVDEERGGEYFTLLPSFNSRV